MSVSKDLIPFILSYEAWPRDLIDQMDEDVVKLAAKAKLGTQFPIPYEAAVDILMRSTEELVPNEKTIEKEEDSQANFYCLVAYIEKGGNVHFAQDFAIKLATKARRKDIMKYLIEKGIDVNSVHSIYTASVLLGDIELVRILVDAGANVNTKNVLNKTAEYRYYDIVKFLLERGATPTFELLEATMEAEEREIRWNTFKDPSYIHPRKSDLSQEKEFAKFLLEKYPQVNQYPTRSISIASKNGWLDMIKYFVYSGGKPSAGAFDSAVSRGYIDIVAYLKDFVNVEEISGDSIIDLVSSEKTESLKYIFSLFDFELSQKLLNRLLMEASNKGNLEISAFLIQKGANPAFQESISLVKASKKGNKDLVALLLEHKADLHTDEDRPLYNAVVSKSFDVIQFLLEKGANIHAGEEKALTNAAGSSDKKIVELLLDHKADLHAKHFRDEQILSVACEEGSLDVVQLLVERKADIHRTSDPLYEAVSHGHMDLVKYLLDLGVDVHAEESRVFDVFEDLDKDDPYTFEVLELLNRYTSTPHVMEKSDEDEE